MPNATTLFAASYSQKDLADFADEQQARCAVTRDTSILSDVLFGRTHAKKKKKKPFHLIKKPRDQIH